MIAGLPISDLLLKKYLKFPRTLMVAFSHLEVEVSLPRLLAKRCVLLA